MSARRKTGGVDPFKKVDQLKVRFVADLRRLPALIERRLGVRRAVRTQGVWWCVRWRGRTYRGLTPAALLKALPRRGTKAPVAEKPPELPLGAP